jgi:transcriptional regulator with XRE-family HTH domain
MLTADQFKNARLLLGLTQEEFAEALGFKCWIISRIENKKSICSKTLALAVRFLLCEAGVYAHFRMLFMRRYPRRDSKRIEAARMSKAERERRKERAIVDALAFKYDR